MAKQNLDMRYKRQEMFDITEKELMPFNANGKNYLAYGNVNLSVFVSDYCNASCNFCVAQLRYFHDGVDYIKPVITDEKEYYGKLKVMLDTVKPLDPSVSLTGGEPTLDPKLPMILNILDSYNVRKRTITTNGSGLLKKVKGSNDTILDRLADYKLQHLNISRAHYDEKTNDRIMGLKNPPLSDSELEEIIRISNENNIRPRLSCILIKEGVNSVKEMVKYMDWAESIGIDNVVFRQLMKFDEKTVKPGRIPDFCKSQGVNLIPLWESLDKDERFSFTTQILGYYYYVEVFKYKNIDMVSEMADLTLIEKEKERSLKKTNGVPVIYELVFHPNGNLCGSWREWKEIIT
ncbi:radical SAM protein [Candidatus Woesearchaeota archaeon]|nr:radical SAM protein [Candidatus Woesearchaeota archaeon]